MRRSSASACLSPSPSGGVGDAVFGPSCLAPRVKIILFFRNANQVYISPHPASMKRGGSRSSRNARRDAVDAGSASDDGAYPRTAKSRGPDAPTLASSLRKATSAGDGGKKARSPGRARYKRLKPLRGECRVNRCDRGDYTRVLPTHCTRGCGRIERPAFPAPSDSWGECCSQNSDASRREIAKSCPCTAGCLKCAAVHANSLVMPGLDPGIRAEATPSFGRLCPA